ncbi:hypothetical protein D915_007585 [Fasciola hepatica]|uniref:Uncharacterized protein n=1 Tax=Fasciola hepatica TaxID=6192 RepID=A0A4E0R7K8_FASHE|nr:hypothetical protein D915_007585 [Fasciola hepatica]
MHPCPNVSKPANLRPPSSVSLLAEQLKSSSLNDTNALNGSPWWSQPHADGFIGNVLNDVPVSASCDVCDPGIPHDRQRAMATGRYCMLCMCGEPTLRSCDANNTRSTAVAPRVSATLSTNTTGEMFGTSPYGPSSVSSLGQSEPEEEDMDPTWRLRQTCGGKPTDLFHHYSTSAPTTEPVYTPYNTSASRSSFAFNTTCTSVSFAPSFSASPSNQNRTTADKPTTGTVYPCTCHAHLLPAKRACRSLSASASAQQVHHQNHTHHMPFGQSRSNRHSQLIDAHLFEAHFSTLPRPIAIRPTQQSGTDPLNADPNSTATTGGSTTSGLKSVSNGSVMLRPAKPREYTHGSRLSWHHPVFSSGLGAKAQHPSYGVNFTCMATHLCTHASRSAVVTGVTTATCLTGATASTSGVSAPQSSLCSVDSCTGRICKHQFAETQSGPCAHCAFRNSPRTHSGFCNNSAFTPTHTRFGSSPQPVQTSDCSLSPDVDLSAASSLQIPVPTPSSGFHEASFSCLSEASSLPDCSKMMESRQEFPSMNVNPSHSKAIDTPTASRRNPCGASNSCTETVECVKLTESALRCRSQPSEPAAPSNCHTNSVNLSNPDELEASKFTSSTMSGVAAAKTASNTTTTTVGSKRRRGPSIETFDLLNISGSDAIESTETPWCLSPIAVDSQKYTLNHSPHPNDGTLVRNGRGSAYPDSGSIFSPFGSWSSSAAGISPFRPPYTLDGGGSSIAGDVFVFGSGCRLEAVDTDVDLDDGTIKRDHDLTLCRCLCHTCQHSRTLQITSEPLEEEKMCMDETQNDLPDGEMPCARSPAWHSTVPGSRAHSGLSCDGPCRAHTFPQLAELSESVEEEKEYETPETITGEESGSRPDSIWKHSFQSSNIKSPSMHEVTFAPIQLDNPIGTESTYSFLATNQSGPILTKSCHPQHSFHPDPAFSHDSGQSALLYPAESAEASRPKTGELLLSLSPTDSDGSEGPDMLSPQLVNREKTKPQSTLSGPCSLNNLPCVGLDLDLIEND